jgi:hypothetical protein
MEQDLLDKLNVIESKVDALQVKPVTNFFGISTVKVTPVAPVVVPEPASIDYSVYVDDPLKSYYTYVKEYGGPKGLVEQIMYNIILKDTFYAPIKEFMKDYPSFFPGV